MTVGFTDFMKYYFGLYEIIYIYSKQYSNIDGLMQERRNSIAEALELRLSCINPSICSIQLAWCSVNTGAQDDGLVGNISYMCALGKTN